MNTRLHTAMAKVSMTYLILGAGCLIVGILVSADVIDGSLSPLLYGALPVGVVLLGLFGISYMLERESARSDHNDDRHADHH